MSDNQTLSERLAAIREKRGYLLPHHGLMAITSPNLLQAYDAAYTAMALDDRVLSHHDREFVWFGVLIATDEALATHHIAKFRNAGGTDAEIETVLAISALCLGFRGYRFVEDHWRPHLPTIEPHSRFLADLRRLACDVPMRLIHMTAAAIHTCQAAWDALELQIIAAYADGVPEPELAEALSLAMFPGSVPYFVEAAGVWREIIVAGKVEASPEFREWALMSGQGGFDEAAGR
ncbi:carboxymuconolactone decarboxylase family protein [Chelativorans sp. Marseille-P2723]|uniref:carboxymuconolactone decarboxylase family protein n=1 Tax=Chelativorans sp. Marseille-P2723 TaxID=2709133 RepID=UPI001570B539|nr:carboxymuconolactone decarboxylase family protein [Chelativorans sp. Marseille-P2723]